MAVRHPTQVVGDVQLAEPLRQARLSGIAPGVESEREVGGDRRQQSKVRQHFLVLPHSPLGRVGERLPGLESEQVAAHRAPVQGPAGAGDGGLGDGKRMLRVQRGSSPAARLGEKLRERFGLPPRPEIEDQRDPPRHLPVVVETARRLEGRYLALAIEGRRPRLLLPEQRSDGPARRLFRHRVVAGSRIEQDAVDVEDHAADAAQGEAHGTISARIAARNESFAAGAPLLTRSAWARPDALETLRINTPRRNSAAWRSPAGRWVCSKRRKLAPDGWTVSPSSRKALATRSRSPITRRVRSAMSSGRARSARAISEVCALRL